MFAGAVHACEDVRIHAKAGVDGKPAFVPGTQVNGAAQIALEHAGQNVGGLNRRIGKAEGADEDVRGSGGNDGERRHLVRAGDIFIGRSQQAVDNLIDGAIAAHGNDDIIIIPGKPPNDVFCMPGVMGEFDQ